MFITQKQHNTKDKSTSYVEQLGSLSDESQQTQLTLRYRRAARQTVLSGLLQNNDPAETHQRKFKATSRSDGEFVENVYADLQEVQ